MVCLKCGVQGFVEALIYCVKCRRNSEHYYCLDQLPKTLDLNVQWLCHECQPRIVSDRSPTNLMVEEEPTLCSLNNSLTVMEQTMQIVECSSQMEVEINGVEECLGTDQALVNDPDYTQSGGFLEFLSDTDDECSDKAESIKRKKTRDCDIAWVHAVKIQKPKHGLVCKYCSRALVGRGSITRLKEHLAGGYDFKTIKACPKVPMDVKQSMKKMLEDKERVKVMLLEKARAKGEEITDFSGRHKVRKDPAWDYAHKIDGKVNAMVCKFCSQTISGGGITRFKRHLSEKCIEAPPGVRKEMRSVLITKDIVKAKLDAKVYKIKRKIRDGTISLSPKTRMISMGEEQG